MSILSVCHDIEARLQIWMQSIDEVLGSLGISLSNSLQSTVYTHLRALLTISTYQSKIVSYLAARALAKSILSILIVQEISRASRVPFPKNILRYRPLRIFAVHLAATLVPLYLYHKTKKSRDQAFRIQQLPHQDLL